MTTTRRIETRTSADRRYARRITVDELLFLLLMMCDQRTIRRVSHFRLLLKLSLQRCISFSAARNNARAHFTDSDNYSSRFYLQRKEIFYETTLEYTPRPKTRTRETENMLPESRWPAPSYANHKILRPHRALHRTKSFPTIRDSKLFNSRSRK